MRTSFVILAAIVATPSAVEPPTPEPKWHTWPAVRPVGKSGSATLDDIESHRNSGQHLVAKYASDPATRGHEMAHFINADIRNQFPRRVGERPHNAFYVGNDRAVIFDEPQTTIERVILELPVAFRDRSFNTYFVMNGRHWNDRPLYLLDEWMAYYHDARIGAELNTSDRSSTAESLAEFSIYTLAVCKSAQCDAKYNHDALAKFVRWQLKRSMSVIDTDAAASARWRQFVTDPSAASLRTFTLQYLGSDWSKYHLHFAEK